MHYSDKMQDDGKFLNIPSKLRPSVKSMPKAVKSCIYNSVHIMAFIN